MGMHLYTNDWGKDVAWAATWIGRHTTDAHNLGKPMVVGEFGVTSSQSSAYSTWLAAGVAAGTDGMNFWMLCGQTGSGWYPNYDSEWPCLE